MQRRIRVSIVLIAAVIPYVLFITYMSHRISETAAIELRELPEGPAVQGEEKANLFFNARQYANAERSITKQKEIMENQLIPVPGQEEGAYIESAAKGPKAFSQKEVVELLEYWTYTKPTPRNPLCSPLDLLY